MLVFGEQVRTFSAAAGWPQRIWRALERLLSLIAENPHVAAVDLVTEMTAVGDVET